ncbi:Di-copper centre-containing protein, partial [Coemansia reversa NRRL 1564]
MHDHISHQIHGNDQFFAWHRRFLRHFESLMQEIDPDAVLPYWNWGTYWQNPYSDPVLSSSLFGGNGRPSDNCVMEGAEARWGRNYPTRNCLTRKFRYGASTGSFWPMRAVRDVMKTSKTHAQFRSRIENGAHGIVHLGLGGDFETMWAPVDVLFFLHHAMIDKIWAEWQSRDPQRFQNVDG